MQEQVDCEEQEMCRGGPEVKGELKGELKHRGRRAPLAGDA